MLRSMFAAISGLRSHQTMMDVTGNNISNVNTTGYKSMRATFQETLTQVVRGGNAQVTGAGGDPELGGVNPMQLGLGSRVAATDTAFTQGASQVTGRVTDLAIQGDGLFAVTAGGQTYYSRAGALGFDEQGYLVGPGGELVLGWAGTPPTVTPGTDATGLTSLQVDTTTHSDPIILEDGSISALNASGERESVGKLALARFANANGLQRVGNGLFAETDNSGEMVVDAAGQQGLGTIQAGTLEMSNVDLAQEFTNLILAQRGFQANARTITASDELLQDLVNLKR